MHSNRRFIVTFLAFIAFFYAAGVSAIEKPGENLREVGIFTQRGRELDLNLRFTNTDGTTQTLKEYLPDNKPTVIVPAYYDCPRLCGLLLDGVKQLIQKLGLQVGQDYRILTVSFDPSDTPEVAKQRFTSFTSGWTERLGSKEDWFFLVGEEEQSSQLMKQLGFQFREDKGEFAHSAAIFIVTPSGKIAQYFTDIQFAPRDVRLALVEAGKGQIGGIIDQVLLYCYRFDPSKGKYTWAAFSFMRAGGGVTLLLLIGLIFWLKRTEMSHKENS